MTSILRVKFNITYDQIDQHTKTQTWNNFKRARPSEGPHSESIPLSFICHFIDKSDVSKIDFDSGRIHTSYHLTSPAVSECDDISLIQRNPD